MTIATRSFLRLYSCSNPRSGGHKNVKFILNQREQAMVFQFVPAQFECRPDFMAFKQPDNAGIDASV